HLLRTLRHGQASSRPRILLLGVGSGSRSVMVLVALISMARLLMVGLLTGRSGLLMRALRRLLRCRNVVAVCMILVCYSRCRAGILVAVLRYIALGGLSR